MPRRTNHSSDDDEPLEDKTAALELCSKRTERQQKKKTKRDQKRSAVVNLTKLPTELVIECLKMLPPGDVLSFGCVNRRFNSVVNANANVIGDSIIRQRYPLLVQCLPLPKPLAAVDVSIRPLLTDAKRLQQMGIHHKPYQHVQAPDALLLCTCLTCVMAWNNLCLVLDFAHWQNNLDSGTPLPIMPRGKTPEWNQELVRRHAAVVCTALNNSLWHARILEMHLDSTIRSIKRQAKNTGNQRKHVEMTDEEAVAGTDSFLSKAGPSSFEFPYNRDEYYMLYVSLTSCLTPR